MSSSKNKTDRFLTAAIITISLVALFYFGYQAISDNSKKNQQNPFEYNIEFYKKTDTSLVHYAEVQKINMDVQRLYGITLDVNDNLYISGDNKVFQYSSDGTRLSEISLSYPATCLAIDTDYHMYTGMSDHIEVYDQKGVKKAQWESLGEKTMITSVAIDKDHVYLADAGNVVVWKMDKSGNKIIKIGQKDVQKDIPGFIIPSPFFDVAIDPEEFLWVTNPGRHSIENYTVNGDFRSSWGKYSMEIEGFCGCCNPTHIAIFDDGKFVTSEKGIARVKIYNRIGQLVSIVAGAEEFIEGTEGLDLAIDSQQRIYILDPKEKAIRIFQRKSDKGISE